MPNVRHHMRTVATVFLWLGLGGDAVSATTEFEAFDFRHCIHWAISSDSYNTIEPLETRRFQAADVQMRTLLGSAASDDWSIFSAHEVNGRSTDGKYGACRQMRNGRSFECLAGFDFPLTGNKFIRSKSKGQLPTLVCAVGCKGASVHTLHDMGYESMEGETNIEHKQIAKQFEKKCSMGAR